ncbi:hypothetical protein K493DRAFT_341856 [Basidiobolus meristosporus CBS 931.73]|uniref:GATA-domain-containing protein n=1 Tax=Basidiobolus meristosporus CBS 931.73 TaxID=1314790 RepID=A0A1Y1XH20_9FUNG|nr:hypothetical protein K493DRAFT_341856 [Basidiobolus meristosporus CBS 931.73]|eukprot:ORX84982.1 hypothetical protein K493DRAFT_341856 [Basidiobolus meristosporus CBS 931.73]
MNPANSQEASSSSGHGLQPAENPTNTTQSSYSYQPFQSDFNHTSRPASSSQTSATTNPFLHSINNSQVSTSISKNNFPISGSHLIEFTKRKNWSHRIIDQLSDLYYVINPAGRFMYCSPSSLPLVGYSPAELVGRNIVDFIHVDDVDIFIRCIKQSISEQNFKLFYRFRKKDDRFVMLEAQGHPYKKGNSTETKCFFSIARPYPLKATSNMDKILELKLENEILSQKLQQLRASFDEDYASPQNYMNQEPDDEQPEDIPYSEDPRISLDLRGGGIDRGSSSSTSNSCITARNDQPIIPATSAVPTIIKKKRKHKLEDDIDRVCTECGKTDSPEWRKGPHGPKTLCNACGLRWAKKSRRESKGEDP